MGDTHFLLGDVLPLGFYLCLYLTSSDFTRRDKVFDVGRVHSVPLLWPADSGSARRRVAWIYRPPRADRRLQESDARRPDTQRQPRLR